MNLYKPSELLKLLACLKISAKRTLSQNFLVDKNIVDLIIKAADLKNDDIILEIGPGPGVLTFEILKKSKVIAIEKDDTFSKYLVSQKNKNLTVINEDFLKVDLNFLKKNNQKIKVISAIPYHLTTQIILKLLKNHKFFSEIVLVIQKEAALRFKANPSENGYNFINVFINFYSELEIISFISKNSFIPKPKVDSAIIKFTIKNLEQYKNIDDDNFFNMVKLSFSQKRKKLSSNLKNLIKQDDLISILKNLNIKEDIRAEELSLNDFLSIYSKISNKIKK